MSKQARCTNDAKECHVRPAFRESSSGHELPWSTWKSLKALRTQAREAFWIVLNRIVLAAWYFKFFLLFDNITYIVLNPKEIIKAHFCYGNGKQRLFHKHPGPRQYRKVSLYIDPTGNRTRFLRDGDTRLTGVLATPSWRSSVDILHA